MTANHILAQRMVDAHNRALAIVAEHGSPENVARLAALGSGNDGSDRELGRDCYQAELIAGLAEIVDDLANGARSKTAKSKK